VRWARKEDTNGSDAQKKGHSVSKIPSCRFTYPAASRPTIKILISFFPNYINMEEDVEVSNENEKVLHMAMIRMDIIPIDLTKPSGSHWSPPWVQPVKLPVGVTPDCSNSASN
jgi:hypothetical protein